MAEEVPSGIEGGRSHLKDWLYSEPGNWLSEVTACISVSTQEFGRPQCHEACDELGEGKLRGRDALDNSI